MTIEYQETLARIRRQLEKVADPDIELNEDTDLIEGLGLDSFKVLDLLLEIEDEFDISVPMNVLTDIHTVSDLARKIDELKSPT